MADTCSTKTAKYYPVLGFAEDNKLALLNTFFSTPKRGVSFTFQSANRGKGQARLDYIVTKQPDCRLVSCVNVQPPPFGVTGIRPQYRIRNSSHPRQVRTKQEEEGENRGNSEDGRPTATDG